MIRILLPLAVIAAILFAPMFSETTHGEVTGKSVTTRSGYYFVDNTIDCWKHGDYSLKGDCKPKAELKGLAIFAALFVSAVAAVLGVLGFLPVIGRLVSFVTTLAGIIVIAGIGYFALSLISGHHHDESGLQWGAYLAGGGGLLTLISGLHGVRGEK